jgi:mono/diheme cytochrome c family protein
MIGRLTYALAATALLTLTDTALATEEYAPGEKLTLFHCGRCHVISERNKYGGIGSTPSFGALRTLEDWELRFAAFWTLNPHPAFTQVEGVTEPFPAHRPSPIHPVELTLDEIDRIIAYARTIPPKDLGNEVR